MAFPIEHRGFQRAGIRRLRVARQQVVDQGLQGVDGSGEGRLGRAPFFKLLPKRTQLCRLIFRQDAKQLRSALSFLFSLPLSGLRGVEPGVAGIDFDEVMHQQHPRHFEPIERPRVCVLGQHYRHQGHVPGMLGCVLPPGPADDAVAAIHQLQFLGFLNERELTGEPVCVRVALHSLPPPGGAGFSACSGKTGYCIG